MRGPLVVLCTTMITGCSRREVTRSEPNVVLEAGGIVDASPAPKPPKAGLCAPEPKGGVVIPDSAHVSNVRIAAAGAKALVTYWEHVNRSDGPPLDLASGHVFDAISGSLGPKTTFEKNGLGDEPVSEAVPVVLGGDLFAISCEWAAPVGKYACVRDAPGARTTRLFDFSGIQNGGPDASAIAAVVKGDDTLVAVAASRGLQLFSARVSAKKKGSPFGVAPSAGASDEPITATLSGEDEATIVYRSATGLRGRRAGFDETWHGPAVDLSAKGMLVGSPAVANEPGHVVALFSQREKAKDPWKVVLADLSLAGDVKRSELPTGPDQAQGPGIARAGEPGCFLVSWVEGVGKSTRTKIARSCAGSLVPSSIAMLSSDGVEGGRAYLASDPATPTTSFAVWQEIPPGKPAELRVARLACR
jgi:hypothetical protein